MALREDEEIIEERMGEIDENGATASSPAVTEGKGGKNGKEKNSLKDVVLPTAPPALRERSTSTSSAAPPRKYRQIDRGELVYRLQGYCRT